MDFSVRRSFSEHLKRWEDNELPDKYDHNCFEYSGQPTHEEFECALDYQMERGDSFIKLEGDHPLEDDFGLSSSITLTMQLSGNADHLFEYLNFRGAYIGEKLVGAYYFYSSNGYTCVDGLIVDQDHRHMHIATTLLKHAVNEAAGSIVFLHADKDDSPREIYERLGFREVDRVYEYLGTDIGTVFGESV